MSRRAILAAFMALLMMGATAAFLHKHGRSQRLGRPGLRIVQEPIYSIDLVAPTNPPVLISSNSIYLPPRVLDYVSQPGQISAEVVANLPRDTTYGRKFYRREEGGWIDYQVVMMGSDRTSIHPPEACLPATGFKPQTSEKDTIRIPLPHPYDLPITRIKVARTRRDASGNEVQVAGVFIYWFVADGQLTADHGQRWWWMARDLVTTGVLQRWAYVICYAECPAGTEDATYDRLRQFIAASVPEYHLAAGPPARAAQAN